MNQNPPENSPAQTWQQQPEPTNQGLSDPNFIASKWLEAKSSILESRARRHRISYVAAPFAILFLFNFCERAFPRFASQLQPYFLTALAWSLLGLFFLVRAARQSPAPEHSVHQQGLDYLRQELHRQQAIVNLGLFWTFSPILLALTTFAVAFSKLTPPERVIFPSGLPFLLLAIVWVITYIVQRLRQRRWLKRELAELRQLES
jgi:hypothetical protein